MNIKTLFRFITAGILLLASISCSKDSAQLQNAVSEEDDTAVLRSHLTDEDLVYDSKGLHLSISLEEAMKRGVSEDEYVSISQNIAELNEAISAELATKSGEYEVAYGLMRISTDNYSTGIESYHFPFYDYDALKVITRFTVPHNSGINLVCVFGPSILGFIDYLGSGQTINQYTSVGSPVYLTYDYNTPLTGNQTAEVLYVIIGIEL